MRKESTDNYENFALLGNNVYDMVFMNYLLLSQNVNSDFCEKYAIDNKEKENILKNMAYYFGTRGPILINNHGLQEIFEQSGIPRKSNLPNLTSTDIITQINMCLKSDAVYVCNASGALDKYTMFILGYLMAMEQEIFFWNDIDESEWLMACISKGNKNYQEVVQFPLEMIRSFAYPYLFQQTKMSLSPGQYGGLIVTDEGKAGVEKNTLWNFQPMNKETSKNTVSLLGSLNKQLECIKKQAAYLKDAGYEILAPKISAIKTRKNGFAIFESDISDNPIIIESNFLENCVSSERIIVCNENGYTGNTVMFEIGYLLAKKKNIEFLENPSEVWLTDTVDYFSKTNYQESSHSYQKSL